MERRERDRNGEHERGVAFRGADGRMSEPGGDEQRRSFYERAAQRAREWSTNPGYAIDRGDIREDIGGGPYGQGRRFERERDRWSEREPWSPASDERGRVERGPEGRRRWQREAITAGEIMTRNPRCANPDTTLQDVARIMRDENVGVVPVIDEDRRLVGMVTDRDLAVRVGAEGKPFASTRAADAMTDQVEAVTPDEPLRDVIELMGGKQIRRVPVVDRNDRLLGIISMADIANRADYDEELQDALERISSRRSFWSRFF